MKRKLWLQILVAAALGVGTLQGDPILIASNGSGLGVDSLFMFVPPPPSEWNSTGDPTIAIGSHPVWHAALPGSSWVSYADTGEVVSGGDPAYVVPNGTSVTFYEDFELPAGQWTGRIQVLADDSVAVFLNDLLLRAEAPVTGNTYHLCSDFPVGCLSPTLIDGIEFPSGPNRLAFEVFQRNAVSFGVDYVAEINEVPEPATFFIGVLGVGFLCLIRRPNH